MLIYATAVFNFDILRNYYLILNRLNFRTLHFGRRHLESKFLVNILKEELIIHTLPVFLSMQCKSEDFFTVCV
jgi:hypothetical protein